MSLCFYQESMVYHIHRRDCKQEKLNLLETVGKKLAYLEKKKHCYKQRQIGLLISWDFSITRSCPMIATGNEIERKNNYILKPCNQKLDGLVSIQDTIQFNYSTTMQFFSLTRQPQICIMEEITHGISKIQETTQITSVCSNN